MCFEKCTLYAVFPSGGSAVYREHLSFQHLTTYLSTAYCKLWFRSMMSLWNLDWLHFHKYQILGELVPMHYLICTLQWQTRRERHVHHGCLLRTDIFETIQGNTFPFSHVKQQMVRWLSIFVWDKIVFWGFSFLLLFLSWLCLQGTVCCFT